LAVSEEQRYIKYLVILLGQEAKRRTPASGASQPQGKGASKQRKLAVQKEYSYPGNE
jgi:hypothetical protein